jgi:hypothetical protein
MSQWLSIARVQNICFVYDGHHLDLSRPFNGHWFWLVWSLCWRPTGFPPEKNLWGTKKRKKQTKKIRKTNIFLKSGNNPPDEF